MSAKKIKLKQLFLVSGMGVACLWIIWAVVAGQVFTDWAHVPYRMNPVAFGLGPVQVHWYGLMYVIGFLSSYSLVIRRLRTERWDVSETVMADFLNWVIVGVLLGGRLGYVLFYKPAYYVSHPAEIFWPFQYDGQQWSFGIYGMSYHGGLLGVVTVFILFCRRRKMDILRFADLVVPAVPLGYAFGRLGNFINGELYGRATTVPWGMFFPMDEWHQLRHPSQLYEMFFEGMVLFVFLWLVRNQGWARRRIFALYLMGYGLVRFGIEFVREPDAYLGFVAGPFTMGQILCLGMIAAGVLLFSKIRERSIDPYPFD